VINIETPKDFSLWRLSTVLEHFPVSRSGWYQGVKDGRYPAPVRTGAKVVFWRSSDIRSLIASL
jgi:prophage regulatory protein